MTKRGHSSSPTYIEFHTSQPPTPTISFNLPVSRNGWLATAPILLAFVSPLIRGRPTVSRRLSQDRDCKYIYRLLAASNHEASWLHHTVTHVRRHVYIIMMTARTSNIARRRMRWHNLANLHDDVRAPPHLAGELIYISRVHSWPSLLYVAAAEDTAGRGMDGSVLTCGC